MADKIYSTDTAREVAEKIYTSFNPGDMVSVFGFVELPEEKKLIEKGLAVLECLRWLYERDHYSHKGRCREYKYRYQSVGGAIAHPIFTWDRKMIDSEPRYIIWRFQ